MIGHDDIVKYIQGRLSSKFQVLANFGTEKRWNIRGVFPDVIVMSNDKRILFIIEVETEESIIGSAPQWRNYSNLSGTLYIVVPFAKLNEAKRLAAESGIKTKFGYYTILGNEIKVIYER